MNGRIILIILCCLIALFLTASLIKGPAKVEVASVDQLMVEAPTNRAQRIEIFDAGTNQEISEDLSGGIPETRSILSSTTTTELQAVTQSVSITDSQAMGLETSTSSDGGEQADLDPEEEGFFFRAMAVLAGSDAPVAGVEILLTDDGVTKSFFTDNQGEVTFTLRVPRIEAKITKEGFLTQTQYLFNSEQTKYNSIRMTETSDIQLVARYEDGTPVLHYRYEVSLLGVHPRVAAPQRQSGEVRDSDGTTEVKGLGFHHQYRIAVLDLSNTPYPNAGRKEFYFYPGASKQEVIVFVEETTVVSGVVVEGDGMTPVPEVEVLLRGALQMETTESEDANRTITDENGIFHFKAVERREGRVIANHETLGTTSQPFVAQRAQEVDPIIMVLKPRARIYGYVTDALNKPMSQFQLSLRPLNYQNLGSTPPQPVLTNEEGFYEIDSITPSTYYLTFNNREYRASDLGFSKSYLVLEEGDDKEVSFRVPDLIEISGTMRINGEPWSGDPRIAFAQDGGKSEVVRAIPSGAGSYSAKVFPGAHSLWYYESGTGFVAEKIDVPAEPGIQTIDIDLKLGNAKVHLNGPDGWSPPASGSISVSITEGGIEGVSAFLNNGQSRRVALDSLIHTIDALIPGTYRADFQSQGGQWVGESQPMAIVGGSTTDFVVDIRRVGGRHQIGQWNSSVMETDFAPYDFTITEFMSEPGTYLVSHVFSGGSIAANIEAVELLMNGQVIQVDRHPGWSGVENRNHIYRLNLQSIDPNGNYQVRTYMRCRGDSKGGIYLMTP